MTAPVRFIIETFFREDEVAGVAGRSYVRTPMLDSLFVGIRSSTDAICENLALLQRDDGQLLEAVVPTHALDAATRAFLSSATLSALRGPWLTATAYGLKDVITNAGQTYACLIVHTSGVFADDLAAGNWGFLLQSGNHIAGEFIVTPSGGIIETNVQAAIVALKNRMLLKGGNLNLVQSIAKARDNLGLTQAFILACTNETVQIPSGTAKFTMRTPFSFALVGVRASLSIAGSTATVVDINRNGVSVLSTKLSIAPTQKTSQVGATAPVISNSGFALDDELTIDIDSAGTGAKGLKVTLLHRAAEVQPDPIIVAPPTPTPTPGVTPTPTPAPLPLVTGAIPTFHCVGLTYKPPANPGPAGIKVEYKRRVDSTWKLGHPLWYDSRPPPQGPEARGSIVHLQSGTLYDVRFSMPGGAPIAALQFSTWPEPFPEGTTTTLVNGTRTTTLALTAADSGTDAAYNVWTFPPGGATTIDVNKLADYCITIAAHHVIIRGLTLLGARRDAIRLLEGAHDVVIEGCDISDWGTQVKTDPNGWAIGGNFEAGVGMNNSQPWSQTVKRIIIQRNKIHDPTFGSSTWDDEHPFGPQGVSLWETGGQHVIRYNEFYSPNNSRYFNDVMGAGNNFSFIGSFGQDTDVYKNKIANWRDDAIEMEGGNRNCRVWKNYLDGENGGASFLASESTSIGPLYQWRNVCHRGRHRVRVPFDDASISFGKAGSVVPFHGGRRYVYHNTCLQHVAVGSTWPHGCRQGINADGADRPLSNTITRNNIFHIKKPNGWSSIRQDNTLVSEGNDFDFDLFNGQINAYPGAEGNGKFGVPTYKPGHGPTAFATGKYQLLAGTLGKAQGDPVPNFSDGFPGVRPDMGAHEEGTADMTFGVLATGS